MKYFNFFFPNFTHTFRSTVGHIMLLICLGFSFHTNAQIIYAAVGDDNGQRFVYKIDLSTCSFCAVTPPSNNLGSADIIILPGGEVLNIKGVISNGIIRTLPPPSTQVVWQSNNPQGYFTGQLAPNGLVYLAGAVGLGTFDPSTNTIVYIGNWPNTFVDLGDLYYINGVLYGTAYSSSGNQVLVQINTNDPSQSVIVGPLFVTFGAEGGTWNGNAGIFYSGNNIEITDIFFYNAQTGTSELICDLPNDLAITGLSFPPPGLPEYPCVVTCTTNAGVLPAGGPYNTCTNGTLNFPATTGTTLDANDLLRYILFTNPSDTAGSIVAVNNTPSFAFNPATMQTGVTYYIAAMAGNGVSSNIDLNDPCLDFSNALQVIWRPLPAVALAVAGNPNVCAGDCRTVTATFTPENSGPFTLTYTSPGGTFTQSFASNTGSFQVCIPAGAVPGPLQVQATSLTDAWCTCQ
jgi:hypothetical protein